MRQLAAEEKMLLVESAQPTWAQSSGESFGLIHSWLS
jgi:hypothetical protein